ncbi:hypothetical protein ACGE24_05285 [Corynebacterium kroppenstedtii]|uniref:hypothetical protein n=1 Tax=Corynebacterium sp. PCR 32 TaxID=3351342 RepID=UPI00309BB33D
MNSAVFFLLGALLLLSAAALLWFANQPADAGVWRKLRQLRAGARGQSMASTSEEPRGKSAVSTKPRHGHARRGEPASAVSPVAGACLNDGEASVAFPPRRRKLRTERRARQKTSGVVADHSGSSSPSGGDEQPTGQRLASPPVCADDDVSRSAVDGQASGMASAGASSNDSDGASGEASTPAPPAASEVTSKPWFTNTPLATRRARRSWASEQGWQFDRSDTELAQEWADHVGVSASEAKDVLSGRARAHHIRVADINENSYVGLRRSGSSDILIDFWDRTVWAPEAHTEDDIRRAGPPRPGQEYAGLSGGFVAYSSNLLAVQLMLDSRAARALTCLRGATSAIVIDPWWILVRCSKRPTVDDLPRLFSFIADLDDAARVLPNPTAEYLDVTDGDPGRPYSYDVFTLGQGPRIQAVPQAGDQDNSDVVDADGTPASHQDEHSAVDSEIGWSDRPEFRHEYVDLPRRDRRRREGRTADDAVWDGIGKSSEDIPVVGSDPDHSRAQERSGRVIRVESDYEKSTIFGDSPSEGRHRKTSDRHGASHRREDDEPPIVDGELEPENQVDQDH